MKISQGFRLEESAIEHLRAISQETGFSQAGVLEILIERAYREKSVPKNLGGDSLAIRFRKALQKKYPGMTVVAWCKTNGFTLTHVQRVLRKMELGEKVGLRPNTHAHKIVDEVECILDGYI